MLLSAYLSPSRHGVYYFRWPLPVGDDRKRHTIRLSLRTRCPNHAGDLARHLASCGKLIKGNKNLARLKRDELRAKVRAYFDGQLEHYLDRLSYKDPKPETLADIRAEITDHEDFLAMQSESDLWLEVGDFKAKAEVSDADWAESQPLATSELRRGRRDLLRAILSAVEELESPVVGVGEAKEQIALRAPKNAVRSTLGVAISDYMAEHAHLWDQKYTNQITAFLNVMSEFFGDDRSLASLTPQDASELKKIIMALPKNRNVKPELKGLPLLNVVKVEGQTPISTVMVNNHIQNYIRFFKWAKNNGHTDQVLFEGMKVAKNKRQEPKRTAFTPEQTRLMYEELTENTSGLVRKDSHKWGTLLGMFTGARLNEICQLHIADVQQENDIWFLNITDEGDDKKRVKAAASRRKVPIHSKLIELGFLEFVESRKAHERLFYDFSYEQNGGYGRQLSRWFNQETFLPKLGLKTEKLVFHSFRHTMVTRLGQAGVEPTLVQMLVGHARAGVTQETYFQEGYTLRQMSEAVQLFMA